MAAHLLPLAKCTHTKQVDGSFLAELRESDLVDSIGMEHPLHLKKLILSRKKLMPLSAEEVSKVSRQTMGTGGGGR